MSKMIEYTLEIYKADKRTKEGKRLVTKQDFAPVTKDYIQAASSLGIGMAFDPFNPEQKWNDRPTWQKAVLIIHLALVAAMFGLGIGLNDK